eukprot:Seg1178.3 transcript_id=Seg1178.3/GoldUCD/mRNA.D3Y31 product="hypothetical protein" protein_id=Seg1178.3/GoldUCD/D3Y31
MMTSSHETTSTPYFTMTRSQEITKEPLHVHSTRSEPTVVKQKRIRRCAGCHEPHSLHVWGLPGPHCPGHDQSTADLLLETSHLLAQSNAFATTSQTESHSIQSPGPPSFQKSDTQLVLEQKLHALELEQKRLTALSALRAEIADKEAAITPLQEAISSANTSPDATPQILELEEGNYVISLSKPKIVSALVAVPKAHNDELRLIHDCSMLKSQGVNSYVPTLEKLQ